MNTDGTIADSLDYLVELSDDAQQPTPPDSVVIIIPPQGQASNVVPIDEPGNAPKA